jgi:FG-GAP-like repeat
VFGGVIECLRPRLPRLRVVVALTFLLPTTAAIGDEGPPAGGSSADSRPGILPPAQPESRRSVILTTGGWETEEIAEAAKQKVELLAKLLDPKQRHPTPAFVSRMFSSPGLRPERLTPVFRDDSLTVLLPAEKQPPSSVVERGPNRFRAVMRRLALPLQHAAKLSVRVKVFKVEMKGGLATTHLYFQTLGRVAAGSQMQTTVQQNATWICRWTVSKANRSMQLESISVPAFQEIVLTPGRQPLFSDCTESVLGKNQSWRKQLVWGIDHWRGRILADFDIGVSGFEGIAVGDVNGDGLDDVYFCQPGGLPNRLLIHRPDGTAVDRSAESRVDFLDNTTSALFVDLDNDGDQDLILGVGKTVVVLANDGRGRFTRKAVLPVGGIPFSIAAADYDRDGRLDFYVCVYAAGGLYQGGSGAPLPWHDANNGAPNFLFRNEGNWKFRDVTQQTGLDANNRRFSFAASWEDFDNDGDQDLYVANDFGRNSLYRNDHGRFVDVAAKAGVEDSSAGMSVTWGDYNNDGRMDLYVSNMFSSAGNRIAYQRRFKPGADPKTLSDIQRHARGNSLFQNMGDGTFRDVSVEAGVTLGRWAWASLFADLNNDGWEDIYVANGFVTQEDTGDL